MQRFRKQDWLELGLTQLVKFGSSGLTVEAMCKAAERTRGSFYHHFESHEAFTRSLMLLWERVYTEDVIEAVLNKRVSERAGTLSELARQLDHAVEIAVRQFAQSHRVANEVLARVDARRISFLTKLYHEVEGVREPLAVKLAQLEYALFVGGQVIWKDGAAKYFAETNSLFKQLVEAYRSSETN